MSSLEPQPARTARPANAGALREPPPPRAELPRYPLPTRLPNGRLYNWQYDLDCFEAELRAFALGALAVYPARPERDVLVPTNGVGRRFGVGRRTVGRWIKAAQAAAREETIAAK
jgi:hypothetical protein